MKGTRTRTRTHSTPPLQRRMSVAPAGCPRFQDLRKAAPDRGRLPQMRHIDFRAGRRCGQVSLLEAVTS